MGTEMRRGAHEHPDRPAFRVLLTAALLFSGGRAVSAQPLEVQFRAVGGAPVSGAIIALRSLDPTRPASRPIDARMDQRDRSFVPHVIIVPPGSKVSFPNSDSIGHQIYSFAPVKKFQLPLYRGNPNPPVEFDKSGLVTLGCNIHDQMRGYILVTPAQYTGRTDATGRLQFADVLPGEYEAQVWHPHARDARLVHEQRVMIPAGATATAITLQALAPVRLREPVARPTGWDAY
jgi:plastocyanin